MYTAWDSAFSVAACLTIHAVVGLWLGLELVGKQESQILYNDQTFTHFICSRLLVSVPGDSYVNVLHSLFVQ